MVKSRLSDVEIETVMGLSASGNHISLVKYIDGLLYTKSLGDDRCARPIAFREKADEGELCFAVGYLNKVGSFMTEKAAREPNSAVPETLKYISELKTEIHNFTHKEEPCQKM